MSLGLLVLDVIPGFPPPSLWYLTDHFTPNRSSATYVAGQSGSVIVQAVNDCGNNMTSIKQSYSVSADVQPVVSPSVRLSNNASNVL